MRTRFSAPALGGVLAILLALGLAGALPATPTGAGPLDQIINQPTQPICGIITDYRAPSPPISGLQQQFGILSIAGVTFNVAPGAIIPPDIKVGANVCFTPTLNSANQLTGVTITQPGTTAGGPTAGGSGNQLCGAITDLQQPQGNNQGTITINGLTYAIAPGANLGGVTTGVNTCLQVTANGQNQITSIAIASSNPQAPLGAVTVCGNVEEFTVPGGPVTQGVLGGTLPGVAGVPRYGPGVIPGINNPYVVGGGSPAQLGRLTVNTTSWTVAPGVRPTVPVNPGSFQCLYLTFADYPTPAGYIKAVQNISGGPANYSVQHVCGLVSATTLNADQPGGTITISNVTYTLDPAAVPTGATIKQGSTMCLDFAVSGGTTAVGVAAYSSSQDVQPTAVPPLRSTAGPLPQTSTTTTTTVATATVATATPPPDTSAAPADQPPADDPNAANQPVVPAAPPAGPSITAPITGTPTVPLTGTAGLTGTTALTPTATLTATRTPAATPPSAPTPDNSEPRNEEALPYRAPESPPGGEAALPAALASAGAGATAFTRRRQGV